MVVGSYGRRSQVICAVSPGPKPGVETTPVGGPEVICTVSSGELISGKQVICPHPKTSKLGGRLVIYPEVPTQPICLVKTAS